MTVTFPIVPEKRRAAIHIRDRQVDIAVVIKVSKGDGTADLGLLDSRAYFPTHVSKGPITLIQVEALRLGIGLRRIDLN